MQASSGKEQCDMILWTCIVVRIVANPFSNVFQKLLTQRGADPLFILCVTHGALTLASLPIFLWLLPPLPLEFWTTMLLCTILTVSGNLLIIHAVKRSDLSVLGPINAYKSIVSLVPGIIFLNEMPAPAGLAGIALIVAGSYFLFDKGPDDSRAGGLGRMLRDRGVQFRFAALVISALEAVVMKRAMLVSNGPATFAFWCAFGFLLSLATLLIIGPGGAAVHQCAEMKARPSAYLFLIITTGLMQGSTVAIFEGLQVGYALALFQLSTLVSVLLGWRVFREKHFVKRMSGSVVMALGAALIILSG
jgi:drug/metabolite transporter (DMT)-like permease